MTTIAFDGNILAVDRAAWKGEVWSRRIKLFNLELSERAADRFRSDSIYLTYAAAGNAEYVEEAIAWMMSEDAPMPEIREDDKKNTMGLVLVNDVIGCLFTNMTVQWFTSFPVADGAGHEMALGAMLAGATAVEAVRFVAYRSSWAAGGVSYFNLTTKQIIHENT